MPAKRRFEKIIIIIIIIIRLKDKKRKVTVIKASERLILSILWLSTGLMCTFRSVSDLLQHKLETNQKTGTKLFANTFFLKMQVH